VTLSSLAPVEIAFSPPPFPNAVTKPSNARSCLFTTSQLKCTIQSNSQSGSLKSAYLSSLSQTYLSSIKHHQQALSSRQTSFKIPTSGLFYPPSPTKRQSDKANTTPSPAPKRPSDSNSVIPLPFHLNSNHSPHCNNTYAPLLFILSL
jgi:hypothetical protein